MKQKVLEYECLVEYCAKGKTLTHLFFTHDCSFCLDSSLNSTKVRGKVLICRHAEGSSESKLEKSVIVKEAGGVGMVLIDESDKDLAIPFVIPSAIVGRRLGERILSHINHTWCVTKNIECRVTFANAFFFPLLFLICIILWILSRKSTSRIFPAKTVLGLKPAPRVTAFSSRGPNALTPEILKVKY